MRRRQPTPEVPSGPSEDAPESPYARTTILPPPPSIEAIPPTVSVPTTPPPSELDILMIVTTFLAKQLSTAVPQENRDEEDEEDDRPTLKRSEVVRVGAPEEKQLLRALAKGVVDPATLADEEADDERKRVSNSSVVPRQSASTMPSRVA